MWDEGHLIWAVFKEDSHVVVTRDTSRFLAKCRKRRLNRVSFGVFCIVFAFRVKMVNGFRYYRALESVSIASALSTALTIYPCQIWTHQRWQSKLQLPTARKKEWRPATADSSPQVVTCQHCDSDTHYFSGRRTCNLPIVGWLLVRRATSSATDSPLLYLVCVFSCTVVFVSISQVIGCEDCLWSDLDWLV